MTRFARTLTILAASAAFAAPAYAATAPVGAAVPATATAQIVDPLTLTKTSDLNFGTLIRNGMVVTQTVNISEAGVVACTSQLLCGGTTSAANFNVAGSANQVVKVYVAPTTITGPGAATYTADAQRNRRRELRGRWQHRRRSDDPCRRLFRQHGRHRRL
jgi:hypothetical protein